MQNRLRAFALVAIITLAATPNLKAETMGTNPKPQSAFAALQELVHAAFAYLGM